MQLTGELFQLFIIETISGRQRLDTIGDGGGGLLSNALLLGGKELFWCVCPSKSNCNKGDYLWPWKATAS